MCFFVGIFFSGGPPSRPKKWQMTTLKIWEGKNGAGAVGSLVPPATKKIIQMDVEPKIGGN